MDKDTKLHNLLTQTGAMSLTLGIITAAVGIVAGILAIVNGGRLLKHNYDMF